MTHQEHVLNNVSENVRRILDSRGWDQSKLAEASGVSRSTVSRILSGKMSSSLPNLAKIVEALDVSLDRLMADPPEETSGNVPESG